ncbi:topoisomerase II-associated protein PAT1-domain-containing protein, partial [Thamnocephalis sphaerospora]
MSDSFFGFDAKLPAALEEERRFGNGNGGGRQRPKVMPRKRRPQQPQQGGLGGARAAPAAGHSHDRSARGPHRHQRGMEEGASRTAQHAANPANAYSGTLDETFDELNDETFGDSLGGSSGNDFDFAGSTYRAAMAFEDEQRRMGHFRQQTPTRSRSGTPGAPPGLSQPMHAPAEAVVSGGHVHGVYQDFLKSTGGSRFTMNEILVEDYQDLMGGTGAEKRPAYAALWDDTPAERTATKSATPGPSHQSSVASSTPVLETCLLTSDANGQSSTLMASNIWGTAYEVAQRHSEPPVAISNEHFANHGVGQQTASLPGGVPLQPQSWGTPSMPAGLPPNMQTSAHVMPQTAAQRPLSLQEIEAELLRSAQGASPHVMAGLPPTASLISSGIPPGGIPPVQQPVQQPDLAMASMARTPLSVAELEAAMKQHSIQSAETATTPTQTPGVDPEVAERHRRIRETKLAAMAKYNGLMTQGDKEYIHKVQIAQLVNQDPTADDFYCPASAPEVATRELVSGRNGRRETGMQRMQQQIQRIVSDAKKRPKTTQ